MQDRPISLPRTIEVLGAPVHATSCEQAAQLILSWAAQARGAAVYLMNVHLCMEAFDDSLLKQAVREAALVLADGRPIYWAQRLAGAREAQPVAGRDLMRVTCREAAAAGIAVGLLGSTPVVLNRLLDRLKQEFPALKIAYIEPNVYPPLDQTEQARLLEAIIASGARVLFVGLGCPKQERLIAQLARRSPCVMLAVGAAFDFLARSKPTAPRWMTGAGLEWLFRLATEPRRLWRRYWVHNTRFLWELLKQATLRARSNSA